MSSINHHVTGIEYWRSLRHLAESPEITDLVSKEFPGYDADAMAGTSRRGFMKLMGAAMALAGIGLNGCRRWPAEQLAPYSANPRGVTPGVPEQYATLWELGGVASGLLVTSYDGRPIKIEGNPSHPSSATGKDKDGKDAYGSADAFAQASLLEMYDPDRSQSVLDRNGKTPVHTNWEAFAAAAKPLLADVKAKNGVGFAILSESTSSPSVWAQRAALQKAYPQAKWFEYEPLSRDNERLGSLRAFGRVQRVQYNVEKAKVIVSLDCDLFGTHPNHIRYANDWAKNRRSADEGVAGKKEMNRVYCAETGFSLTGSAADIRLAVNPARLYAIAYAIASQLTPPSYAGVKPPETTGPVLDEKGKPVLDNDGKPVTRLVLVSPDAVKLDEREKAFVDSAVKDLIKANGAGFVAVGPNATPDTHALAHLINISLHAIGNTIKFWYWEEDGAARPTHMQAIADLTRDINAGGVDTLLILGGNPAYDAPSELDFAGALGKVKNSIHLSLYDNETSQLCKWHLPRAHYLECWGDGQGWDGTLTLQQPIIQPLFGGKSAIEVLAIVNGDEVTEGYQIVRRTLKAPDATDEAVEEFDKKFRAALELGYFPKDYSVTVDATPSDSYNEKPQDPDNLRTPHFPTLPAPDSNPTSGFTLSFTADSRVYDGRFANNGWLQETPDPLSKLMWENALLISVKEARDGGLDTGDTVELTLPRIKTFADGRAPETTSVQLSVPVCVLPGQPKGVLSLSLGYGRTAAGNIGTQLGFNACSVRCSSMPWVVNSVQMRKTGQAISLASSAEHHLFSPMAMAAEKYRVGEKFQNGKIIREATLAEYNEAENAEDLGGKVRKVGLQLFQEPTPDNFRDKHAWGMAIDLAACIGCNNCAVACQAENNIPIVGKEQSLRHREMNWIRIDRYFRGDPESADSEPEVVFQPMACQHCENAPCEQVCPVAATVHDSEGLNTMVYNRCIGTRYCANNCPYKVRRFNYFDFHSQNPRSDSKWLKNPWPNIPDLEQRDPKKYDLLKRMAFNPEVTVRMRGVMEKCTFCVQRIHTKVIEKRGQGKDIVDGDIITACQQACPTEAIVFGDLNDTPKFVNGKQVSNGSKVYQMQQSARAYDVLHDDLNTRPRTRYLSKLRNPVEDAKA